ncbi:sulfotransferase family 2 domain-containing protein [Aequorivita xiaoshiensis]|uniref:Sulfotransferase family protein n=1 Tax=Aequorivita xiaoshiensis TaxID=2874476 RepID=A0A9X1UDZ1_9FLAO|nr:sulfotransferase family 2 domain-containing protein [Aequorivita xiaoshiensis]MCG2432091.1 sulfotransferase family protein [Aequorivita xiaoshiensis]
MINHKHKVIFIHIPKCAGSSIETAFGIDVNNNDCDKNNIFGWDDTNKIYLQHATPQELIDFNIISREHWSEYYKFIVVRNTWDKVMSDFFWFKETKKFKGLLEDYLYAKNDFSRFMKKGENTYRGDHLTPQIDYMYLDGKLINYNKIIYFDKRNLDSELSELSKDLNLPDNFFQTKVQVGKKFKHHYSKFYTNKNKDLVFQKYKKDINYFNFKFEDKRDWKDHLKLALK